MGGLRQEEEATAARDVLLHRGALRICQRLPGTPPIRRPVGGIPVGNQWRRFHTLFETWIMPRRHQTYQPKKIDRRSNLARKLMGKIWKIDECLQA